MKWRSSRVTNITFLWENQVFWFLHSSLGRSFQQPQPNPTQFDPHFSPFSCSYLILSKCPVNWIQNNFVVMLFVSGKLKNDEIWENKAGLKDNFGDDGMYSVLDNKHFSLAVWPAENLDTREMNYRYPREVTPKWSAKKTMTNQAFPTPLSYKLSKVFPDSKTSF